REIRRGGWLGRQMGWRVADERSRRWSPAGEGGTSVGGRHSTGPPGARQVHRRRSPGLSRTTGADASGGGSTTQGAESLTALRPSVTRGPRGPLEPIDALGRPNVDRLFDLNPRHFLARLVEAQHGIVVHLKAFPVDLGLEDFRPRNDIVPEDDLLAGAPE